MIRFTDSGIVIRGVEKPLYSGSMHYWRIQRENWDKVLNRICDMGFEIIETYIPWSVHEYEEGKYDFGEIERNKDLDGFLALCEEKGLSVIVRPGPHINAEMTLFGYPEWILMDEEIQAKNPWGTTVVYPYVTKQFPIPSYACEKLYDKTEAYFMKLRPILKEHAGETGCIILIQADNETCNFFRDKPYIMDYSEASIRLYHRFLSDKYKEIEALNRAYRSSYDSFGDVGAPSGFKGKAKEDLPYYFDWVEYKEYQILYSLKRIVSIIQKLDLGIPVFHNCAYQDYTPVSVQRDEQIEGLDVAGIDAYPDPEDTDMLRRRIRYLTGSSRLPYVPEFGSGSWFDRGILLTAAEEEFGYLYSLMNGLKAVNFYMLTERDRWTGCPITNDGRVRTQYYELFFNFMKMMKEHKLNQYYRNPRVLILRNYDMGRFRALYSVMDPNPLSSNCFITGPDIPQKLLVPEEDLKLNLYYGPGSYGDEGWVDRMAQIMDSNHYDYNYSDQFLPEEKWKEYDVIIASAYDFMECNMQEQLLHFSEEKGKTLIIGPYIPSLDRDFCKCEILKKSIIGGKDCGILVVKNPEDFDAGRLDICREYICENPDIEISVHRNRTNPETHLLYVANKKAEAVTARLYYGKPRTFFNIWRGKGCREDNCLVVSLPAYTVQIWKVEMEEARYD